MNFIHNISRINVTTNIKKTQSPKTGERQFCFCQVRMTKNSQQEHAILVLYHFFWRNASDIKFLNNRKIHKYYGVNGYA